MPSRDGAGGRFKGRGAVSDNAGRFAKREVHWDAEAAALRPAPKTELRPMQSRRIISRNDSPDIPFDRSINPYQGCEHGCIYCYARPSHSYFDLSPGLDFETKIFYKPNAVSALLAEWEKENYNCQPITIGANTDPYQPAERRLRMTRQLLEKFHQHRHPVSIITKGTLVERDIDLLAALAAQRLASVAISIPTADNGLKRVLEPRVPSAGARFEVIKKLTQAGIPVSLLMAPVIPVINDREIESIVGRAAEAGASHASWILLRLPHELKALFVEWLNAHMPERAEHVMSQMRQAGGGRDYDNRFGIRQRGQGPYAAMLNQRFSAACRHHSIGTGDSADELDCSLFQPPGQRQMALALG